MDVIEVPIIIEWKSLIREGHSKACRDMQVHQLVS